MRFSNRLVGLPKPNWTKLSVTAVWLVFAWFFFGTWLVGQIQDPNAPIHDPVVPPEYARASIDTAFAMQEEARQLGLQYRAEDYARDMVWLRSREQQVRHHLSISSPFDGIVRYLYDLAVASEQELAVENFISHHPEMKEDEARRYAQRTAMIETTRRINDAVGEASRSNPDLAPITDKITWDGTVRFIWHVTRANLWAMLATLLLLILRLALSRKHSFKDEVILAPGRLLWATFWWGHGILHYPGDTVAEEVRYVRLRQRYLRNKDSWGLTVQEEAALRLMARDRIERFDVALETIHSIGDSALVRPKRTVLVSVLIWFTSGSLNQRAQAQQPHCEVTVTQTPEEPLPDMVSFTTIGGDDFLPAGGAVLPSLINWSTPYLVCLGGVVILMDKRRKLRTIRNVLSRAPPVITGGTR